MARGIIHKADKEDTQDRIYIPVLPHLRPSFGLLIYLNVVLDTSSVTDYVSATVKRSCGRVGSTQILASFQRPQLSPLAGLYPENRLSVAYHSNAIQQAAELCRSCCVLHSILSVTARYVVEASIRHSEAGVICAANGTMQSTQLLAIGRREQL